MDGVGVTPKLFFARIVRFQGAFERWGEDPRGWARVAADCGYYDQAHLLRDFRQFAGDPPGSSWRRSRPFRAASSSRAPEGMSHFSNWRRAAALT